jgi:hypothetical protein
MDFDLEQVGKAGDAIIASRETYNKKGETSTMFLNGTQDIAYEIHKKVTRLNSVIVDGNSPGPGEAEHFLDIMNYARFGCAMVFKNNPEVAEKIIAGALDDRMDKRLEGDQMKEVVEKAPLLGYRAHKAEDSMSCSECQYFYISAAETPCAECISLSQNEDAAWCYFDNGTTEPEISEESVVSTPDGLHPEAVIISPVGDGNWTAVSGGIEGKGPTRIDALRHFIAIQADQRLEGMLDGE